jgi:hypothetical protein
VLEMSPWVTAERNSRNARNQASISGANRPAQ